jgi:hypothetical protein
MKNPSKSGGIFLLGGKEHEMLFAVNIHFERISIQME